MTEDEWWACQDYLKLMKAVRSQPSARKWRLASLACAQLLPAEWQGAEIPVALTLATNIVEGRATFAEAESFLQRIAPNGLEYNHEYKVLQSWWVFAAWKIIDWVRPTHPNPLEVCRVGLVDAVCWAADAIADPTAINRARRSTSPRATEEAYKVINAQVCPILRDIFGNPFHPVTFSSSWRTDTAIALARTIYESREFSGMPILADALQDAGCDNPDILSHCRDTSITHVRGCWVVDLVLGME